MAQSISTLVQNRISDPRIASNSKNTNASSLRIEDKITASGTDEVILCPIPAAAIINLIDISIEGSDDEVLDIGIYRPHFGNTDGSIGFEAVDVNCISNNLDLSDAIETIAVAPQRVNGLLTNSIDKKLYEIAGLTNATDYPILYIGFNGDSSLSGATFSVAVDYTI